MMVLLPAAPLPSVLPQLRMQKPSVGLRAGGRGWNISAVKQSVFFAQCRWHLRSLPCGSGSPASSTGSLLRENAAACPRGPSPFPNPGLPRKDRVRGVLSKKEPGVLVKMAQTKARRIQSAKCSRLGEVTSSRFQEFPQDLKKQKRGRQSRRKVPTVLCLYVRGKGVRKVRLPV